MYRRLNAFVYMLHAALRSSLSLCIHDSTRACLRVHTQTYVRLFFVYDFHSDDTCDLGDALKCVTVAVPMHCDVAFFPILTITAMIQITLAMLSKV